jgi:hypothetical protein
MEKLGKREAFKNNFYKDCTSEELLIERINCKEDAIKAHKLIDEYNEKYEYLFSMIGLKREYRRYFSPEYNSEKHVYGEWDSFIETAPFPDNVETYEDADRYFLEHIFLDRPNSPMYDCTGKFFTNWYKIFKRRGKYFYYTAVDCDC